MPGSCMGVCKCEFHQLPGVTQRRNHGIPSICELVESTPTLALFPPNVCVPFAFLASPSDLHLNSRHGDCCIAWLFLFECVGACRTLPCAVHASCNVHVCLLGRGEGEVVGVSLDCRAWTQRRATGGGTGGESGKGGEGEERGSCHERPSCVRESGGGDGGGEGSDGEVRGATNAALS